MTEAEWLNSSEPQRMLEFVREMASDRKLRLLGCARVRQVWHLLTDECFRTAVEAAEQFADGRLDKRALYAAKAASGVVLERRGIEGVDQAVSRAIGSAWSTTRHPALTAAMYPVWVADGPERAIIASQIRDVFGNPFRPVAANPAWLTSGVVGLARAIYDERAFGRMQELADALSGAGCTDAEILAHCRRPGEHVRGCWVVDLLLGKA